MILFSHEKKIKFLTTIFKNFGLPPYKPSLTVAVVEGAKPLATAIEIWPLVDLWYTGGHITPYSRFRDSGLRYFHGSQMEYGNK